MADKELWRMMAAAPDGQLDATIAAKFRAFADEDRDPTAAELKSILDECAFAALASDFTMLTLSILWQTAVRKEREAAKA